MAAAATCCVLSCTNDASEGATVTDGQVNGVQIKLFIKPEHSSKMCAVHVTANQELVNSGSAAPMSLASSLGGKPSAKIPALMRARAAGALPRQSSLDLPPRESQVPVASVARSDSTPEVSTTKPATAVSVQTPIPTAPVAVRPLPRALNTATPPPVADGGNSSPRQSPRTPAKPTAVAAGQAPVPTADVRAALTSSGKIAPTPTPSPATPPASPSPTTEPSSGKGITAPKIVSSKAKTVEENAQAAAELHNLAIDKQRVRPFLEQLDKNAAFREKMTGELKKGAELKRVGEKGALSKLHLRVTEDGDFLVLNSKTPIPLAELDEVRLGQTNDNFARNSAKLRTFASNSFSYVWLRHESIDVIAGSDLEFQLWSVGLRKIFDRKRDRVLSALAEPWMELIGSREEKASTKDMAAMLSKFNCNSSPTALREKLGIDENVKLGFNEFLYHFRRVLRARPEIEQLFTKYSSNKILLRPDELLAFLKQDQQDVSATLETAQAIVKKYRLMNADGDRMEAGRRGAAKSKQELETKERQARIDAKLEERKKGFEQRRVEKQTSQDAVSIGLTPEQLSLPREEKIKVYEGQLKQLSSAIAAKETTKDGLDKLVSFYSNDAAAQEQARKEVEQLNASLVQMKESRTALEKKLNGLKGGDKSALSEGDEQSRRQAVAKQAKELEDNIAAKQRSLAGLERLIAGYASDPAAQARVRKEVADGRAEITRLTDAKQRLEKQAVELLASGASNIDANDSAAHRTEIENKYKEVRAELRSKLTSRRALVKMVQVYAADPAAQAKANKQLSDETAKLADLLEVRRLLERQMVELGAPLAAEDPEMEAELERLVGSDGAQRGDRALSASQVSTLLANATAAASTTGKEKELGMTLADFADFMEGEENWALSPSHAKLSQDMTRPLCEYWIASSHNTYLTGDQFQSDSSVEMYVKVLKSGCRCIEVDIWDGPDGEPIVYHGHTLTSKISFRDVCRAIAEYAFVASPYPVILSFENHCSLKQQQRMAEIIRANFKHHLAIGVADNTVLPSPEELKERILIKGKTNSGELQEDEGDQIQAEEQADRKTSASAASAPQQPTAAGAADVAPLASALSDSAKSAIKAANAPTTSSGKKVIRPLPSKDNKEKDAANNSKEGADDGNKVSTTPDTMHPALSDITYLRARRFVSFDAANQGPPKCECSSFGEQRFLRLLQTNAAAFADLNKRALSRTYPKGTRVDSSNYSPVPCWNAGIQLVAINYQTPGRPMWHNQGRFAVNGGCGYVLKPDLLRNGTFDPNSTTQRIGKYAQLEVLLMSAALLPVGCSDPLVILSVTGLESDNKEFRSKAVKGNGFNPTWNERFFFTLQGSELAIFMLCVETEAMTGDQRVAQVAFPVEALRPGYRIFPLYDREGRLIPLASVLCKISLRRPDELKTL